MSRYYGLEFTQSYNLYMTPINNHIYALKLFNRCISTSNKKFDVETIKYMRLNAINIIRKEHPGAIKSLYDCIKYLYSHWVQDVKDERSMYLECCLIMQKLSGQSLYELYQIRKYKKVNAGRAAIEKSDAPIHEKDKCQYHHTRDSIDKQLCIICYRRMKDIYSLHVQPKYYKEIMELDAKTYVVFIDRLKQNNGGK